MVQELIEAPDLEAMGTVLDVRLRAYVGRGSPTDERLLAERCAFEHEVRRFLTRAQERGYAYPMRFPQMPTLWVDFVNQNKTAETNIARLNVRRSYEAGRHEATEATNEGCAPGPKTALPARPDAFDPIAMIDRLVQDAVAQRVAQLVPANVAPSRRPSRRSRSLPRPSRPTPTIRPRAIPIACPRCCRNFCGRPAGSASTR